MMHPNRRFNVVDVQPRTGEAATAEESLAIRLTESSWTLCTGFRLGDILFLNDATSEDGAPEWAVFHEYQDGRRTPAWQIESITFGWTTRERALRYIRALLDGSLCTPSGRYTLRLDHPAGSCPLCE